MIFDRETVNFCARKNIFRDLKMAQESSLNAPIESLKNALEIPK